MRVSKLLFPMFIEAVKNNKILILPQIIVLSLQQTILNGQEIKLQSTLAV